MTRTNMKKAISIIFLLLSITWVSGQMDEQLKEIKTTYDSGDLGSAMTAFNSYIAENDQNYLAYKLRGDCRQKLLHYEDAILDYDSALSISKEDPRIYVSRGAARMSLGKLKQAIRDFDRVIEMDPDDADAYFNRGGALYLSFDNRGALKDLNQALALDPEHADALFIRGVVKGELYNEKDGIEDIERALLLKTELDGAQMSLAVLLYEIEEWEKSIEAFSKVIDSKDKYLTDALYYRGDCKYNLGNKETACIDWQNSADLGDDDAIYIVANYCNTEAKKIPKKRKKKRNTTITF